MNPVKALGHAEAMCRNAKLCADAWGSVLCGDSRNAERAARHLHEWASVAHGVWEPNLTEQQIRDAWGERNTLI